MGWEVVVEVEPITLLHSNLGSYFYAAYITMLCYARRRDLGLCVIHDSCEIVN